MNVIVSLKTGLVALALALGTVGGAQAATMAYATGLTVVTPGKTGTEHGRNIQSRALGNKLTDWAWGRFDFYELGAGSTTDFVFGTQFGRKVNIVEFTNGTRGGANLEKIDIYAGLNGVFTFQGSLTSEVGAAPLGVDFLLKDGRYDTLRLVDTTKVAANRTGGYDVDRISVAPVPVPAAGGLLLAGLGALAALRRRRKA